MECCSYYVILASDMLILYQSKAEYQQRSDRFMGLLFSDIESVRLVYSQSFKALTLELVLLNRLVPVFSTVGMDENILMKWFKLIKKNMCNTPSKFIYTIDEYATSFPVTVTPSHVSERCGLSGAYRVAVNVFNITLIKETSYTNTGNMIICPFKYIKRYKRADNRLILEIGRMLFPVCGKSVFETDSNEIYERIRDSITRLESRVRNTSPVTSVPDHIYTRAEWQSLEHRYDTINISTSESGARGMQDQPSDDRREQPADTYESVNNITSGSRVHGIQERVQTANTSDTVSTTTNALPHVVQGHTDDHIGQRTAEYDTVNNTTSGSSPHRMDEHTGGDCRRHTADTMRNTNSESGDRRMQERTRMATKSKLLPSTTM